jgi:hypothetical protein
MRDANDDDAGRDETSGIDNARHAQARYQMAERSKEPDPASRLSALRAAGQMAKAPDLASRMSAVRAAGGTLGAMTDELNTKLAKIEQGLVRLQLGVTASVEMVDFSLESTPSLAFAKWGNSWRLVIEHPEVQDVPLVNASRELRLCAADYMPTLVQELLKKTAEETVAVKSRLQKLDEVIAVLGVDNEPVEGRDDEIPF